MGSAAKKDEVEELISSFTAKLDEISKQANNATTKDEVEELSKKLSDEMEKLIGSAAKKDEMEELKAKIASAATESKTQEKIFMKFCAKGEKRGEKAFEDFIFIKEIKTKLANIYESIKNNIIALFTIIRTDRNMLLACYSHKHISYRIRTIIRKAII